MTYMTSGKEETKQEGQELENLFFNFHYLNWDISLNIHFPNTIFHILIENMYMEGTVSQIFYLRPSFNFMKCRKIIMKK